jgi:hypothetical protein
MLKKPGCYIPIIAFIIVFVLCSLVGQFLPTGLAHTNPPVLAEPSWDSPRTRELFMRTCGDCHSNETAWPWYSNIAPFSWLIQNDVMEGRAYFNVSEWGMGENEAGEAAGALWDGEMPPQQYKLLHPEARLSDSELHELYGGLLNTFGMGEGGEGNEEGENGD